MFGLICTLSVIAISLYTIKSEIYNFVNRTSPVITSTIEFKDESLKVSAKDLKIFFQIEYFDMAKFTFKPFTVSEVDKYTRQASKTNTPLTPLIGFTQINDVDYVQQNITYTEGKEIKVSTLLPMVQCDKSFFENFNKELGYGVQELSQKTIDKLQETGYCIPSIYKAGIYTQQNDEISVDIRFLRQFVMDLSKESGQPYIVLNFNYQRIVYSVNSKNYNSDYYKHTWEFKKFFLNSDIKDKLCVYITKTDVTRNRKIFLFDINDFNSTHGIKEFESLYSLPAISKEPFEGEITLQMLLKVHRYRETLQYTYVSIDSMISDYGGITAILFPFFEWFVGLVIGPFYSSSIVNEVFKFHENNMNDIQQKEFMNKFKHICDSSNYVDDYIDFNDPNNNFGKKLNKISMYTNIL